LRFFPLQAGESTKTVFLLLSAGVITESYTVKLTATGDGTMNYSVKEHSATAGEAVRIQNYYNVLITNEDEFTASLPAYQTNDLRARLTNGSSIN